jgi:type I restriction enzyme S subunit
MSQGMKDSGIQWIGDIPDSWNIKRIKYSASLKGRIGWQGLTSEEYQDDGSFLITGVDFQSGGIDWENCVHVPMKRWEEARDIQIRNGDLLITKDGTIGKVALVSNMPGETSLNSGVLRIIPVEGYSRRFLFWVLQSEVFWNWFNFKNAGNSTILHLYQGDFAEFIYAFPEYTEQESIADFLDVHCAKLDSIIADLEMQIDTLQKFRKSFIAETVTKGLDRTVPMKDSGIEWCGKTPSHWRSLRMQDIASYKKGPFGSAVTVDMFVEKADGTYKVYEQKNAIQADANLGWYYLTYEDYRGLKDFSVKSDDIIISCAGTIGKCFILPDKIEPGIINQALMRVRLRDEFNKSFFIYLFDIALEYMNAKFSNGSAIKNIPPFSVLKKQWISVPPLKEQEALVDYLDVKCSAIDQVIMEKSSQLATIKEFKDSLVFEYVTGKKRVKEAI